MLHLILLIFLCENVVSYNTHDGSNISIKMQKSEFFALIEKLEEIPLGFNVEIDDVLDILDVIRYVFSYKYYDGEDFRRMHDLAYYVNKINNRYERFVECINKTNYTVIDKGCIDSLRLDYIGQLIQSINKTRHIVHPQGVYHKSNNLFYQIMKKFELNKETLCDHTISAQSGIFELYKVITLSEIRGFAMLYVIQKSFDNIKDEIMENMSFFELWHHTNIRILKKTMVTAPRSIRRCNARMVIKNVSYFTLENSFRTYIRGVKEENSSVCNGDFFDLNSHPEVKQHCSNFDSCAYIGDQVKYCLTSNTTRLYKWIELNNGTVYGDHERHCSNDMIREENRQNYGNNQIHYCICNCSPLKSDSHEAIILKPAVSDQARNMVVTGLRFVRNNGIIQIQIKQGKLSVAGHIIKSTNKWKPVYNIVRKVDVNGKVSYYENGIIKLYEGLDYFLISKHQKRIYLDDIITVNRERVVTGVQFVPAKKDQYYGLKLRVKQTAFDFFTGALSAVLFDYWWKSSSHLQSTELKRTTPASPIYNWSNNFYSSAGQFIEFRASDLKSDAGQTTVPFFDARPVETIPGFPLAGIGLAHRGEPSSGEYLTFQLFTINVSSYHLLR